MHLHCLLIPHGSQLQPQRLQLRSKQTVSRVAKEDSTPNSGCTTTR